MYRIVMFPVLVLLIVFMQTDWFKWLLAISFFTDAIDGYLARTFSVTSIAGATLDSIGDDLTVLAGIIGMVVFKSEFFKEELIPMIMLALLYALQTVTALIKYGRMTSFHTYAAKTAAVAQGVFLILLFFLPAPILPLFYLTMALTGLAIMEEILIVLRLPERKANVKGLYWVIKDQP